MRISYNGIALLYKDKDKYYCYRWSGSKSYNLPKARIIIDGSINHDKTAELMSLSEDLVKTIKHYESR